MKGHLRDADKIDWVLGHGTDAEAARHLETCESCRRDLREAAEGLSQVAMDAVPDPGAAFWSAFSRGVARRARERSVVSRGWGWRVLAPAGLAAALAVAMTASVVHWPSATLHHAQREAARWTPLPPPQTDEAFQFLEVLAATDDGVDDDAAACWMGECLADLSDAEARSVKEWFQAQVGRQS